MGEIIGSRTIGDRVIYKIMVNENESLTLKGSMRNIHLFSLDLCDAESRIIERGKEGVTKHFLIPTKHRPKPKKKPDSVSYQAIDLDSKTIFIYTVDK
ncbi:hypothetical protein KY361_07165 [Candidatus Woesearchaeota archaeon]|nr:hypothetical protein [Candidatus Woesearchaeota archaeon]